jgi:hypothetical protein
MTEQIEIVATNACVLRIDHGDDVLKFSILDKRGHFRGIAKLRTDEAATIAAFLNDKKVSK